MLREKFHWLDVVTSIFILVSIVVVGMVWSSKITEKKHQMLCTGQLRHVGTAFRIYQGVYDRLPEPTDWLTPIVPFVENRNALFCPSCHSAATVGQYSYKLNASAYRQANSKLLLFDAVNDSRLSVSEENLSTALCYRHLGGANLLFLDGSVEYQTAEKR